MATRLLGELDVIVGQDGMNPVGHDTQKMFEKLPGCSSVGLVRELHHRKLACPVYDDEKMLLAFSGLDLGDVEVEEPDRVAFEALSVSDAGWWPATHKGNHPEAVKHVDEKPRSSFRPSRTGPLSAALWGRSSDPGQSEASATSPPFLD